MMKSTGIVDRAEIDKVLSRRGLNRAVADGVRAFVEGRLRSPGAGADDLRGLLAEVEKDLERLRSHRNDSLAAALALATAMNEVVAYLMMLWAGEALRPGERKLVTPYLTGDKAASNMLPDPTYKFTTDWVSDNVDQWKKHLGHLAWGARLQFLEVGAFEGRSAVWFLDNILTHETSRITCIDTFSGHAKQNEYFDFNIAATGAEARVEKRPGLSQEMLRLLPRATYNLIYIDASHFAFDVAQDSILAWPLLKPGGFCLFDDYELDQSIPEYGKIRWTRRGVDAFLHIVDGSYEVIHHGWQLLIRKTI